MRRLGNRSAHTWMLRKGMLGVLDEYHRGGRSVRGTGFASDLARLGATRCRRSNHSARGGGIRVRFDLLIRFAGFGRGRESGGKVLWREKAEDHKCWLQIFQQCKHHNLFKVDLKISSYCTFKKLAFETSFMSQKYFNYNSSMHPSTLYIVYITLKPKLSFIFIWTQMEH